MQETQQLRVVRVIPTGVGNSARRSPAPSPTAGHPHRRGELRASRPGERFTRGSSPQAWGTQQGPATCSGARRVIPTGVGNSARPARSAHPSPGHPHRRGELLDPLLSLAIFSGSSPQAWGTPLRPDVPPRVGRVIPTGVGNSPGTGRAGMRCTGHPHRRGELLLDLERLDLLVGSSPQAWGTPRPDVDLPGRVRVIPTGVGNSIRGGLRRVALPGHPHRRGELHR